MGSLSLCILFSHLLEAAAEDSTEGSESNATSNDSTDSSDCSSSAQGCCSEHAWSQGLCVQPTVIPRDMKVPIHRQEGLLAAGGMQSEGGRAVAEEQPCGQPCWLE